MIFQDYFYIYSIVSVDPKSAGGSIWPTPVVFPKIHLLKRGWNLGFFLTFNIIISHIFPEIQERCDLWWYCECFIEVHQVVMKTFSVNISYFQYFSSFFFFFLHFLVTRKLNLFQNTSNRLFNNCIKLFWY